MRKIDLMADVGSNPYPGRGIVLGVSGDGKHGVIAYFIMGRSENSRNRVFVEKDGGIITQAFDPSKLVDPSLILYAPVRVMGTGVTVVTNGDQTDTVVEHLKKGGSFENALRTRTFEPDAPNFTPRISGLLKVESGKVRYKLAILKANEGNPNGPQRFFFEYPAPEKGEGHFLHTYLTDGNPIPSFEGEPKRVAISGDIDAFTETLWASLNEENKVSLFVRYVDTASGKAETRIINKNQ